MANRGRRRFVGRLAALVGTAGFGGCQTVGNVGESESTRVAIAVGSKTYVAQRILGALVLEQLAARTDYRLVDNRKLGGTRRNWNALTGGGIACYWEYTGTHWAFLPPQHDERPMDPETLYQRVRADAESAGVTALPRATYTNPFVLVTTRRWQDEHGVETLGDLADFLNAGNSVRLALGLDFFRRPDGWVLLRQSYDIDPGAVSRLDDAGNITIVPIGLTYELLADGTADIVMGFNTDPQVTVDERVVLADDRDYTLPYNPVPMVNSRVLDRAPGVRDALAVLGPALDSVTTMRNLAGRVVFGDETPRAVARSFLEQEGIR